MACNSVATTSAQAVNIILDNATLQGMVSKLTGAAPEQITTWGVDAGQVCGVHGGGRAKMRDSWQFAYTSYKGLRVELEQRTDVQGQSQVRMNIIAGAGQQSKAEALKQELQGAFEKLLIVGQQGAILKKLQELGKLSNVVQKDGGVVARVTVDI